MQNTKWVKLTTYGAFFIFFLFGFVDNLKGPTLPPMLQELGFSYSVGGSILLGSYLGFLVATVVTGSLADLAGRKLLVLIGCVLFFMGAGGYSFFHSFWGLTLAMFIFGLGLGVFEIGANMIIVDIHGANRGRYLNLLGFFHGAGSMLAPLYAGWLLEANFSWRTIFQLSGIYTALLFLYFLPIKYPIQKAQEKAKLQWTKVRDSLLTFEMVLYYLIIMLYVASEIGVATWLVEFLQQSKSQSVMTSTLFLSLFFGAITLGRFLGSFIVDRVGYLRVMLLASLVAIVFLSIGTFAPPWLAFFIPCVGFCFSIVFPTVTAAVSELHKENLGMVLGVLFAFAGIGGMLGAWAVGVSSDWLGIHLGFGTILIFIVTMCILFFVLFSRQENSGLFNFKTQPATVE